MPPITLRACSRSAWTKTLHSLGLDQPRKRAISVGVVALALVLLGKLKGWDFVKEQLWYLVAVVGATILVFVLFFLLNLFRAPLHLANELVEAVRHENESLRGLLAAANPPPATRQIFNAPRGFNLDAYEFRAQAARPPGWAVNELAQLRAEGARLLSERVPSGQLEDWIRREGDWRQRVLAHLRQHFTEAVALGFQHPGVYRLGPSSGSASPDHRKLRGELNRRLERLQDIISRSA